MTYYIYGENEIIKATEAEAAEQEQRNRELLEQGPEAWKDIKLIMSTDLLRELKEGSQA